MNNIDYVIIGSGFTGSVLARRLAEEKNKRVIIVEERNHIAGNMYDTYNENGVLEQRYGIHVFHTDKEDVYRYLCRFTEWIPYSITCLAEIDGKLVGVPFNFECIDAFWPAEKALLLKEKLLARFKGMERVPILRILQCNDPDIREFGGFLFEKDYRPYTCKQWGRKPDEIDSSILNRVQVALSYDNRYFSNRYQFMPKDGFTKLFERLLDHKNIEVHLACNAIDHISFNELDNSIQFMDLGPDVPILYTGALDRLFNYVYGQLPYRTLRFEYETHKCDYYQSAPFIVYPLHETLTRITEFKRVTGQILPDITTIVKEYPMEYTKRSTMDPFYPIPSEGNQELFLKYAKLAKNYLNLITCGRLADYKYYDMDNAVIRAFEVFESLT